MRFLIVAMGLIVGMCGARLLIEYINLPVTPPYMSDGITFTALDNSSGEWKFCTLRWREVRSFTLSPDGKVISFGY